MFMYREITESDVGGGFFRAFGRTWLKSDFIGRILPHDVGKRVYLRDGVLQVENDEQREARRRGSSMIGGHMWLTVRGAQAVAIHTLDEVIPVSPGAQPSLEERDAMIIYAGLELP